LRSFENRLPEFMSRGINIVAISVDTPEESHKLAQSRGYTFPILSDRDAATIRAYGVLHPHAREDGGDIARPAEFLVDPSGTIRWENFTENLIQRLRPETFLKALD
jgi:peroxiredoxin